MLGGIGISCALRGELALMFRVGLGEMELETDDFDHYAKRAPRSL
jgi:hypothetical protein